MQNPYTPPERESSGNDKSLPKIKKQRFSTKQGIGILLLILGCYRIVSIFALPTIAGNYEAPIPDAILAGGIAIVGLALFVAKPKLTKQEG